MTSYFLGLFASRYSNLVCSIARTSPIEFFSTIKTLLTRHPGASVSRGQTPCAPEVVQSQAGRQPVINTKDPALAIARALSTG